MIDLVLLIEDSYSFCSVHANIHYETRAFGIIPVNAVWSKSNLFWSALQYLNIVDTGFSSGISFNGYDFDNFIVQALKWYSEECKFSAIWPECHKIC